MSFVEKAHRAGTSRVYDYKWSRWESWCRDKKVRPLRPFAVQLANFLADLAAQQNLSSPTVKVFHAAIVSTIKQRGGRVRGTSSRPRLIQDVLKGISSSYAASPRRVPLWDLFLVLDSLRSAPFEPLNEASRFYLTLKTVFLVTLASGRRSSGVNGLSGLPQDVCRDRDGSFLLHFLPEFRAKNQADSDPSPVVRIPPLSSILADDYDDVRLCPVRALRRYLAVTSPTRPVGARKLFLSVNSNFKKDISANTLARWLRTVVQLAYGREGLPLPQARAHEIRAWSASITAARNMPLTDILQAAYWKSEDTFINFYLRDCALTRGDGSHGISSLVAAQRPLRLQ